MLPSFCYPAAITIYIGKATEMNKDDDFLEGKPRWRGSLILLVVLAIPLIGVHLVLKTGRPDWYLGFVLLMYVVFIICLIAGLAVVKWWRKRKG